MQTEEKKPRDPLRVRLKRAWGLLPHFPRTIGILRRTAPGLGLALTLVTIASGLAPAAAAYIGKLIVDAVAAAARHEGQAGARVARLVILELALMAAMTGFSRLANLLRELLRAQLGYRINLLILDKARTLELRHFEDSEFYDKMQRARREASVRPLSMLTGMLAVGQNALTIGSYALLLWRLSPWTVLLLVAAGFPAFIAEARLSGQSFRLWTWRAPEARKLDYLEWVLTRDAFVKEVKIFGLADLFVDRYQKLFQKFYSEDRALALKRFAIGLVLSAVGLLAFYGCYLWMADRASQAQISLGDLTLYVAAFRQGQGAFQAVLGAVSGLYEDGLFMSNLFAFLDMESQGERSRVIPARTLPMGAPQPLELRSVGFRYAGKESWALKGIDLTIAPGEMLALCGDNGAGKTTLVQLLMRLHDPTEGEIRYGGIDLRDFDPADLRRRIAVVFQDFVRYQFSAAENIGLGHVPAIEDLARIEQAARASGADAVAQGLPKGYQTMLGGWFEAGQELSTGQWQKIATARAFMRDAEILILDEPTAALDAEAEHELIERFKKLAQGRTAIVISHRFSTVRLADRIALLRGGQVEELGTHAELLARDGRYAHLFRLQAAGYLDDSGLGQGGASDPGLPQPGAPLRRRGESA